VNNAGEQLWRRAPRLKATLRDWYYRVNARKGQEGMTAADREWLDDYFREDIGRLRELTNDLPGRPAWLSADQAPRPATPAADTRASS
jgi:hypothetical protein